VFIAIMEDSYFRFCFIYSLLSFFFTKHAYFSSINTQDKYKGTGKDTHLAREHEPTVALIAITALEDCHPSP
jgi:hypothetical protein